MRGASWNRDDAPQAMGFGFNLKTLAGNGMHRRG